MADMFACRHHVNQLIGNILRMRSHEANALNPHLVQFSQQLRKAQFALHIQTIRIDVLPQQHDFFHAFGFQFAGFLDDACRRAGTLAAADIRHNAVRAEIVAAVHDGDIRVIGAAAADGQILRNTPFVVLNDFDHAAAGLNSLEHQLRKPIQVMRAESQIDERILLQNLFAHTRLLHHAAANADHQFRARLFKFF